MSNRAVYTTALGAVPFSKSLAPYYADDKEKREKYAAQLSENLDYALKVKSQESPIKTLAAFAQTSASVAKLVEAKKQAKAKEEIEERNKIENLVVLAGPGYLTDRARLKELQLQYKTNKELALHHPDAEEYNKLLARVQEQDATGEYHQQLSNLSPRHQVYLDEMMARNIAASWTQDRMTLDPHFREKYSAQWTAAKGDTNLQDQIFHKFRLDKLAHLDLNNEVLAGVVGEELSRQGQTFRNKNLANQITAVTTQFDLQNNEIIKQADNVGDLQAGVWDVRELLLEQHTGVGGRFEAKEGYTSAQQVDDYIYNMLGRLADDGYLTSSQLQPYIQKEISHPAGPGGISTLDGKAQIVKPEQVQGLISRADNGSNRHLAVRTLKDKELLAAARQAAAKGENVTPILNRLRANGLVSTEAIDDVDQIDMFDNTPEAYAREKAELKINGYLNSGNLIKHEEYFKLIKNDQLKREMLARVAHQKAQRTELGYPKDDEKFIRDRMVKAMKLTLGEDQELTGKLRDLQIHLVQKLRRRFQEQTEGPNGEPIINPEGWTLTNNEFETYIVNNGITVRAGQNQEGEGIFSVNGRGELVNFKPFQEQRVDAIRENKSSNELHKNPKLRTQYNKKIYDARIAEVENPSSKEPLIDRILDNSESILSREDILGFFTTKRLSPEIIYKAQKLGIPPSTLIRRQLGALVATDPEYAKMHDLDKLIQGWPEGPDEQIYGILERIDSSQARDLKFNFVNHGLSPNQNQRMVNILTTPYVQQEYLKGKQQIDLEQELGDDYDEEKVDDKLKGTSYI